MTLKDVTRGLKLQGKEDIGMNGMKHGKKRFEEWRYERNDSSL
jgi:hypothetical protein